MPCSVIYAGQTIVNKHSQQNNQQNPVSQMPTQTEVNAPVTDPYALFLAEQQKREAIWSVHRAAKKPKTACRCWEPDHEHSDKKEWQCRHKLQVPKRSRSTWLPRLRRHCNNLTNLAYWRGNCKKRTKGYSRWVCSSPQIKFTIFNILFRT